MRSLTYGVRTGGKFMCFVCCAKMGSFGWLWVATTQPVVAACTVARSAPLSPAHTRSCHEQTPWSCLAEAGCSPAIT